MMIGAIGCAARSFCALLPLVLLFLLSAAPCNGKAHAQASGVPPPFKLPPKAELNKLRNAVLVTNRGPIYLELYPDSAPWHVANFKYLADKGFYRGLSFHLLYDQYIIQGGDPSGTGGGGPGYSLPPEFSSRRHMAGTLGMARIGGAGNPERRSNGSQFHILLREAPKMDGDYTVFGQVVKGMKTVRKLKKGDTIRDLIVYVTP
ncbi:MAG: peptidylprolyl isomerase [Deltaproteobacteria bacterium]|nr:peptidylprolyl isomerase [Deltaproteobacteria bacterium]